MTTYLLWGALNLKLAWAKAGKCDKVDWIGAEYAYRKDKGEVTGVDVATTAEKEAKLLKKVETFLDDAWAERTEVKMFAGLVALVASVVKAMHPYSRMIWAAAMSRPAGQETWTWIHSQRVRLPLIWLVAAAKSELGSSTDSSP